jgi:peptidoglycan DL-endopeptidase CwlO
VTARRALSAGLALMTTAGILATGPTATAAPSLKDAKSQAAALAHQVASLTDQAEIASENFDAAEEQLGGAVNSYLVVEQQLADAQATDAATKATVGIQATALYESGGAVPLYAEALNGVDLGDVVERLTMAGNVLNGQRLSDSHEAGQTAALVKLNAKLATAAATRTKLQSAASRNAVQVKELLAQQTQLLASANSNVKKVVVQLQQEAEKAAADKFAQELAAARAYAQAQNNLLGGATAPTPAAGTAVLAAQSREGTPYVWGATGPGEFDCSGLTSWAYAQAGIALPRTSREQWFVGHHVALADLEPGDLLFWATDPTNPSTIHHVAIYAGNGYMIAAPHTGAEVSLQRVYLGGYIGATRPTG